MSDIDIAELDASQVLTASVWPTGSTVRLLQVPWDAAYRDVVAWKSKEERDEWFRNKSGAWYSSNFQNIRPGEPVAVPVPYSSVYKYNYLTVTNPKQPVTDEGPERTYFYFITSVEYLSPQATRLTVQLDVMTTYAGDIEFGRAFVESGHVAMANANLDTTGGKPNSGETLLTYMDLQEGIDCGSALVPVKREFYQANATSNKDYPLIMVVSTADLTKDPGTINDPDLDVAPGSTVDELPGGCSVYAFEPGEFRSFMKEASRYSWVAQCIISIYSFPRHFVQSSALAHKKKAFGSGRSEMYEIDGSFSVNMNSWTEKPTYTTGNIFDSLAEGLTNDSDLTKLYAYPYSVIELSSFTGNPIYLQPQYVRGNRVALFAIACGLAPFAKVGVFPWNYGSPDTGSGLKYSYWSTGNLEMTGEISPGDFIDTCVWLTDFPQFSLVNNAYMTYMASTAHTRAYQYDTAAWNRDRGNMQAKAAYLDAANYAKQSYTGNADVLAARGDANIAGVGARKNTLQQQYFSGAFGGLLGNVTGGVASGAAAGPLGLAAGGVAGAAKSVTEGLLSSNLISAQGEEATVNAAQANNVLQAQVNAAKRMRNVSLGNAARDYNTALSVNTGDYKNAVAAINAATSDAQLTPPSTIGQMGGNGFNWANGLVGVCITYKTVTGAARQSLSDYFRRYGYSVRRFMPLGTPNDMLVMDHFAYWRVLESNIVCAGANETEREAMRGIMEKGVTLWAKPEYIGTTDVRENKVRTDGTRYSF